MYCSRSVVIFVVNDTATTEIYTLSLHDALPICPKVAGKCIGTICLKNPSRSFQSDGFTPAAFTLSRTLPSDLSFSEGALDRKSTRLNSSHANISYAVFCLKKKIFCSTHNVNTPS